MPNAAKIFRAKGSPQPRGSARQRGYTRTWEAYRAAFLREKEYICAACGRLGNVVDHIKPHRQNQELFWAKENWQVLCAACHQKKTARGE